MSKVTVTVTKKKRKPRGSGGVRRKGIVAGLRDKQDLGRRRVAKGGVINFYAIGQQRSGEEWIDRLIYNQPTATIIPEVADPPTSGYVQLAPLASSDWQGDIRDVILGIANLGNLTRRLQVESLPAALLTLTINAFDAFVLYNGADDWTNDGFKLSGSVNRLKVQPHQLSAYAFDTGDPFYKVTADPTFASDAVVPSFSGAIDVFLVPEILFAGAMSNADIDNDFVDRRFGGAYYSGKPWDVQAETLGEGSNDAIDRIVAHPTSRTWNYAGSLTPTAGGAIAHMPPAEEIAASWSQFGPLNGGMDADAATPPGFLYAIIKSGASTYYVWKN